MTSPSLNSPAQPLRRLLFNRFTVLAFVAGAAVAIGIGVSARAAAVAAWHHCAILDGTHSAAEVDARVDRMLKHFYAKIGATDAQKAQISPLVKQAVADLLPLHSQLHAAHTEALQALTQNTIDRASLESLRQQHLQLADQTSKRIVQLIADVGDVLTPTQRQALAAHLQQLHGTPKS
jgi:Spy/CpxP family protein refolding chaperone